MDMPCGNDIVFHVGKFCHASFDWKRNGSCERRIPPPRPGSHRRRHVHWDWSRTIPFNWPDRCTFGRCSRGGCPSVFGTRRGCDCRIRRRYMDGVSTPSIITFDTVTRQFSCANASTTMPSLACLRRRIGVSRHRSTGTANASCFGSIPIHNAGNGNPRRMHPSMMTTVWTMTQSTTIIMSWPCKNNSWWDVRPSSAWVATRMERVDCDSMKISQKENPHPQRDSVMRPCPARVSLKLDWWKSTPS
mmetsp:Transcript_17407/g.40440  ORF Transcript_17407/g.40440 Transcript_17407/m.40440 type:complete len:246 (+) Transcript_17407:1134-1871(+)